MSKSMREFMEDLTTPPAYRKMVSGSPKKEAPVLTVNGRRIHALSELREHFYMGDVAAALADGTLRQWLKSLHYEDEAQVVWLLEVNVPPAKEGEKPGAGLEPATEQALCRLFGVDYLKHGRLSPEERSQWEAKRDCVRKYTDDPEVLSRITEIATNQSELAEVLAAGITTVYLCGGSFLIPIRKSGIHYIGIGDPGMEAPFTEEQYRRAGITFEGVTLPKTADPASAEQAQQAAKAAGYDEYGETHGAFATLFHDAIKGRAQEPFCYLGVTGIDVMTEFYRSRGAALRAAGRVIDEAYDKANRFFIPGSKECLAEEAAQCYGRFLARHAVPLLDLLREKTGDRFETQLQAAEQLVTRAEQTLRGRFEAELRDDADFYKMYERRHFHEKVDVDDFGDDAFDSPIANGIMNFLFNNEQYMVDGGLQEALTELQNDANAHGKTFYAEAHRIYLDYCRPLEKIAEEIGRELSDEELRQWGLPEAV